MLCSPQKVNYFASLSIWWETLDCYNFYNFPHSVYYVWTLRLTLLPTLYASANHSSFVAKKVLVQYTGILNLTLWNFRTSISIVRIARSEQRKGLLDVIELNEPDDKTDPTMLRHDMINNDVTRHVTHGFVKKNFRNREKAIGHSSKVGETNFSHEYHGKQ